MKLTNYNSEEQAILKEVLSQYQLYDPNISLLIESFIYRPYKTYHTNGQVKEEGVLRFYRYHGTLTSYYEDGEIECTKEYTDGVLHGKVITYFPMLFNGKRKIQSIKRYCNDLLHGLQEEYHESWSVYNITLEKKNYNHGVLTGEVVNYYLNGRIRNIKTFDEKGLQQGHEYTYDTNENIIEEVYYINGLREGEYILRYWNGKLAKKGTYVNGKLHSIYLGWYENGNLEEETNFNNGVYDGVCRKWYYNGKLKEEMCYFKNLLNGGYKKYYDNGNISEDMCFICGLIHGTRRLYTQEGKLMLTTIHYKGEIKSLKVE